MKMKIPPELQDSFDRLMQIAPPKLRKKEEFKKTTLAYLAFGGESLARQNIVVSQRRFPDTSSLFKFAPMIENTMGSEVLESDEDENKEKGS